MTAGNIQTQRADAEPEIYGLFGETRAQCIAVAKLNAELNNRDIAETVRDALTQFNLYVRSFPEERVPKRTVAHTLTQPINYLGESWISDMSRTMYGGYTFALDYINTANDPSARLRWMEQLANRLEANVQYLELGKNAPSVRGPENKLYGWQQHLSEIAYIYCWAEQCRIPEFVDTHGKLRSIYSPAQLGRTFDAISMRDPSSDAPWAYAHLAMLTIKDSTLRPAVEAKKDTLKQLIDNSSYQRAQLCEPLTIVIGRLRASPLLEDTVSQEVRDAIDRNGHEAGQFSHAYTHRENRLAIS